MAAAQAAYCARWTSTGLPLAVLFVTDVDERNEMDHRKLEAALFNGHGIISLRRSIAQLAGRGSSLAPLEPRANAALKGQAFVVEGHEVSVAYFRSGYWPEQFTPKEECWDARERIEVSEAVKCPSAPAQLAGMKKVQQLLCTPVELSRFLEKDKAAWLSTTFGRQVDPSSTSKEAQEAVAEAKACRQSLAIGCSSLSWRDLGI